MTKKPRNMLIAIGVIVALTAAVFVYMQQKDQPAPTPPPNATKQCKTFESKTYCAEDYVGLREAEAISKAASNNIINRVVERDGESFPVDLSYSEYRLNFTVKSGVVTKVEFY